MTEPQQTAPDGPPQPMRAAADDGPPAPAGAHTLESILDELARVAETDGDGEVSVGEVMAAFGERSFGPLLLVPSLIGLSPIGAIPMVPAVMVAIEILIIGQMLLGWQHFWLPQGLARRALSARRFLAGLDALRPAARLVDVLVRPRLAVLTEGPFFYLIALLCLLVAIVTPVIELVPIAGIVPNAAVVAFSLALTARDGLWALAAFAFTVGCVFLIAMAL